MVGLALSNNASGGNHSDSTVVRVSLHRAKWVSCVRPAGIETLLQVVLRNTSSRPLKLGDVRIAQERIYRKNQEGKMELVETTASPDEFSPESVAGPVPEQADRDGVRRAAVGKNVLLRGERETFELRHYVYFTPSDLQSKRGSLYLTASFHITNVLRDGQAADYWSDPITIELPPNCEF